MKNIKEELSVYLSLGTFIALWIAIILLYGLKLNIDHKSLVKLPEVVTAYAILTLIFRTWLWRWKMFKGWLVPFPDLQGTWRGELISTWATSPSETKIAPIPVIIVIKQSFDSISCQLFTPDSESYSVTAQINEDDHSGSARLVYNYINRSRAELRDGSPMHDGAASVRIVESDPMQLEGLYWTSRRTTGDLTAKYISRSTVSSFNEGMGLS